MIDDTCHGGDECAHVARAVVATLIEDHFCDCALVPWRWHMRLLPASVLSSEEAVIAYMHREHVGEPFAGVSI